MVDTDRTAPHKNHDANSPLKPPRVEPTTSPIQMTNKKLLTLRIVIPDLASSQQSMRRSLTYKVGSLAALLAT